MSDDIDNWRTFAAMFYGCSVAGYGQWNTCPKDAQAIEAALKKSGLDKDNAEEIDILKANGEKPH